MARIALLSLLASVAIARRLQGVNAAGRAGPAFSSIAAVMSGGNNPNLTSIVSVLDFGAVGDGKTDNTAAFQAALASLQPTGGVVYVPAGQYSFSGSLNFTRGISMVGTYQTVPSHDMRSGEPVPADGSVLFPRAGRGNDAAQPFLTLVEDCTLKGVVIYYPDQDPKAAPVPYPWSISMIGVNSAVQDVELLNSWNGISAVQAHRHYIARVQGQPANIGIFVDQTYDIGRIEDVHWNPWFSNQPAYQGYQDVYGVGFKIARSDWEYVFNTFVFAMSVGYQFVQSPEGACNGNFLGIGADCCQNASVLVEATQDQGLLITNGEFTSFAGSFGPDVGQHTQVIVTAANTGAVRFVNSAFWGPSNQIAYIEGTGSVGFTSCVFRQWDAGNKNQSAIELVGGDLILNGNEFQSPDKGKTQVLLGAGSGKAVITNNLIQGPQLIVNNGAAQPVIANNAAG